MCVPYVLYSTSPLDDVALGAAALEGCDPDTVRSTGQVEGAQNH